MQSESGNVYRGMLASLSTATFMAKIRIVKKTVNVATVELGMEKS